MLFKQKIISFRAKNKIIYGLNKIEREISNKKKKNFFIPMDKNNIVSIDIVNKIIITDPLLGLID